MRVVGSLCFEIVFAAVFTDNRRADVVYSAKVEDELPLLTKRFAAQLTDVLQAKVKPKLAFTQITFSEPISSASLHCRNFGRISMSRHS